MHSHPFLHFIFLGFTSCICIFTSFCLISLLLQPISFFIIIFSLLSFTATLVSARISLIASFFKSTVALLFNTSLTSPTAILRVSLITPRSAAIFTFASVFIATVVSFPLLFVELSLFTSVLALVLPSPLVPSSATATCAMLNINTTNTISMTNRFNIAAIFFSSIYFFLLLYFYQLFFYLSYFSQTKPL